MINEPVFRPFPEWRELKEKIWPLLSNKREFTYQDLRDLGIDAETPRGRAQFYIFRKHALREWSLWFECRPKQGYEAIPAGKHAEAAVKRVRQARGRVRLAQAIEHHTRVQDLSPNERSHHAQIGALIDDAFQILQHANRKLTAVAQKFRAIDMSSETLSELADAPMKKPIPSPSKFKSIEMSEEELQSLGTKKAG